MKRLHRIIRSIPALTGILLVILVLMDMILFQESFLNYTNKKYHVADKLNMEASELEHVTDNMIAYMKSKNDSPQTTVHINGNATDFFNAKELRHLEDVQRLYSRFRISEVVMLLIWGVGHLRLVIQKKCSLFAQAIIDGWIALLVIGATIGICAAINIKWFVRGFHQLFLADSNWVLNPALDRSVWMFRNEMYVDALLLSTGIIVVWFGLTLIPVLYMRRKYKN